MLAGIGLGHALRQSEKIAVASQEETEIAVGGAAAVNIAQVEAVLCHLQRQQAGRKRRIHHDARAELGNALDGLGTTQEELTAKPCHFLHNGHDARVERLTLLRRVSFTELLGRSGLADQCVDGIEQFCLDGYDVIRVQKRPHLHILAELFGMLQKFRHADSDIFAEVLKSLLNVQDAHGAGRVEFIDGGHGLRDAVHLIIGRKKIETLLFRVVVAVLCPARENVDCIHGRCSFHGVLFSGIIIPFSTHQAQGVKRCFCCAGFDMIWHPYNLKSVYIINIFAIVDFVISYD